MEPQLSMPRSDRARDHTSGAAREKIDRLTRARLAELANAPPEELGRRLEQLDHEWDLDRALMMNFAVVGGFTFGQGVRQRRMLRRGNGWLYFFGSQVAFMAMHALVGWCPPSIVFRRMGIRTDKEIAAEREAVRALLRRTSSAGELHAH